MNLRAHTSLAVQCGLTCPPVNADAIVIRNLVLARASILAVRFPLLQFFSPAVVLARPHQVSTTGRGKPLETWRGAEEAATHLLEVTIVRAVPRRPTHGAAYWGFKTV